MNKEQIINRANELFNVVSIEDGEWPVMVIDPAGWFPVAGQLRRDPVFHFDYLFCITCIDWKTHLQMQYHLHSTISRQTIVVKANLDPENPSIHSVEQIWKTAGFHEREVYEMFGVNFIGHPDLRLLILPEGWEGKNPMRKDFDDPVNMIRL